MAVNIQHWNPCQEINLRHNSQHSEPIKLCAKNIIPSPQWNRLQIAQRYHLLSGPPMDPWSACIFARRKTHKHRLPWRHSANPINRATPRNYDFISKEFKESLSMKSRRSASGGPGWRFSADTATQLMEERLMDKCSSCWRARLCVASQVH